MSIGYNPRYLWTNIASLASDTGQLSLTEGKKVLKHWQQVFLLKAGKKFLKCNL
jgi:hypothetical protein